MLRVIPLTRVQKRYLLLVKELRLTFGETGSPGEKYCRGVIRIARMESDLD